MRLVAFLAISLLWALLYIGRANCQLSKGSSTSTISNHQTSHSYIIPKAIPMAHFGTEYGGHNLPTKLGDFLGPESIAIMAGVGEDITFDTEIAALTGATIHLYDPTPRAIMYVDRVMEAIEKGIPKAPSMRGSDGSPIGAVQNDIMKYAWLLEPSQIIMHRVGVGPNDEKDVKFMMPKNPDYVSASANGIMPDLSSKFFTANVVSVETLLKEFGTDADRIDLFKVNIEGLEIPVLDHLLASSVRPKIVCATNDVAQKGQIDLIQKHIAAMEEEGFVRYGKTFAHTTFLYNRTLR